MRDQPVLMTLGELRAKLEQLSAEFGDDTPVVTPTSYPYAAFQQPKQVEACSVEQLKGSLQFFNWSDRTSPQPKVKAIVIH